MNTNYVGMIVADLHIGAINPSIQYNEFKSIFLDRIEDIKPDYIIFLGDYFDHKASLNDELSYYSFYIFDELISRIKENNLSTKIRFVYGTESHEWDQYNIINIANKRGLDVSIIHTVTEEELFPDFNVLYIPEEHIYNKSEYYKDYLNNTKKYDYIFGHGIIREVMREAAISNESSTNNRKKVPIFNTGELMYACKGQVYFGHYHINTNINDEIFYVGSFNRWCFGEEEDKGFYKIETNRIEYSNEFIVNNLTPTYKTISFGYDNKIFQDTEIMENKLKQIDNMVKDKIFDNVRFEFNIPPNVENPEYIMNFIKERYRFNKRIKTNIVHGYIEDKKKKDKEEIDKWNVENAPLFNKDLSIEDKISFFISLEFKRELSPEKINLYINNNLSDIIRLYNENNY